MAKKRRAQSSNNNNKKEVFQTKFDEEEAFQDSQDEFFAEQDKILLNEEPAAKRRRKLQDEERNLQPSDEEVLSYDSEDNVENESVTDGSLSQAGEDEEDANWGLSRSDYYNNDAIETEADAVEEAAEAQRLQQKQLTRMTAADFGFDDNVWANNDDDASTSKGPVIEKLPEVKIPVGASLIEKSRILHGRYPEFEPLATEFRELQRLWQSKQQEGLTLSVKGRALSTYLGALAMYFAVLTMKANAMAEDGIITATPPDELRDHAIISHLTVAKQLWDSIKDIDWTVAKPNDENPVASKPRDLKQQKQKSSTKAEQKKPKQRKRITNGEDTEPTKVERPPPKTKRIDLKALLTSHDDVSGSDTDFGDENPLTEEQTEEKARKRKSLRFYSSQIAQKANKRGAASREAGGDDDLSHKERLRDRQERLLREAEKRGQQAVMDHERLDTNDAGDMSVDEQDDADAYYQSLVANSKRKRAEKQAKAVAYVDAARHGGQIYEEESVGPDGKRAITYAIQKNKGLMPKRSKDVRNPRVKKRKKYDEKKKKLGSMKQIYKGGEGRGGYRGELTGIKTNIIKSVKL